MRDCGANGETRATISPATDWFCRGDECDNFMSATPSPRRSFRRHGESKWGRILLRQFGVVLESNRPRSRNYGKQRETATRGDARLRRTTPPVIWLWIGFLAIVFILLALDLGVFNRHARVIEAKEALAWTGFWVALAMIFSVGVYFLYENHLFGIGTGIGDDLSGKEAWLLYLTAYITEKSLSLDNVFVFALILTYFQIPREHQHRVLFWGVLGALILRGAMIAVGAALIHSFDWITYVFGAMLLYTAVKLLLARNEKVDPDKNLLVRFFKKRFPVTQELHGEKFIVKVDGKIALTPLFFVLVLVDVADVIFAVDSIPAVFAITSDPFLVFTSNVFAILGLRSLYFALAAVMEKFRYMKPSLVFLLAFVGVKMLLAHTYHIPAAASLAIIVGILCIGVLASLFSEYRDARKARAVDSSGETGPGKR